MSKIVKSLKAQYKDYTIYQSSCIKSPSKCTQLIVNNINQHKIEKRDNIIIRSTTKQLYRYLKWWVDNVYDNNNLVFIDKSIDIDDYPVVEIDEE